MLILMIVAAWFFVSTLVVAMCVAARAGDEHLRAQADHLPLRRADRMMQVGERDLRRSAVSDPHDAQAA
jgi:hypothetical protein